MSQRPGENHQVKQKGVPGAEKRKGQKKILKEIMDEISNCTKDINQLHPRSSMNSIYYKHKDIQT